MLSEIPTTVLEQAARQNNRWPLHRSFNEQMLPCATSQKPALELSGLHSCLKKSFAIFSILICAQFGLRPKWVCYIKLYTRVKVRSYFSFLSSCCRDSGSLGVYIQLYWHCSEPLEHMATADRPVCARAREIVHTYRDGGRARDQTRVTCPHTFTVQSFRFHVQACDVCFMCVLKK